MPLWWLKSTGVHVPLTRAEKLKGLCRYITSLGSEGFLMVAKSPVRWILRLFKGLAHMR